MKKEKREEFRKRISDAMNTYQPTRRFDEEDVHPQAPLDCNEALALLDEVDFLNDTIARVQAIAQTVDALPFHAADEIRKVCKMVLAGSDHPRGWLGRAP